MSESTPPPAPSRAVTRRLIECKTISEAIQTKEFADRVAQAVPSQMKANTLLRSFIQATSRSPDLLQVDMRQGIGGFLTLAELGLPLTPTLGMAYMIPFKGKKKVGGQWVDIMTMNIIVGYQGLLELASRSGMVGGVHAEVVLPGDEFDYRFGTEQFLHHRPKGAEPPGAAPLYAWAIAHLRGDVKAPFEVMPWRKILSTRDRSQGYQRALHARDEAATKNWSVPKTYTEAPWIAHTIPMAEKTVFRQLAKWLPKSVELQGGLSIDEPERGYVDFGPVIDGALAAEGLPITDDDADPGAAFGTRTEADPKPEPKPEPTATDQSAPPAKRGRPPRSAAPAAPPAPAAEQEGPPADEPPAGNEPPPFEPPGEAAPQTPVPQASTGFEAFLFDHTGEVASDELTDPMRWAREYVSLLTNTEVDDRPMVQENNADVIGTLPPAAQQVVERGEQHLAQQQALAGQAPPPVTQALPIVAYQPPTGRDGKPDWPAYANGIKALLPEIGYAPPTPQWLSAQYPALRAAPPAQRIGIIKAIVERFNAVGREAPPELGELVKARAAPAAAAEPPSKTQAEKDRDYIADRIVDIDQCATQTGLRTYTNRDDIQRRLAEMVERGAGELVSQLKAHAKQRLAMLPP
jgi:recombination protein RecT